MIEAVIFDMDGVIIDSEHIYMDINRMLFKELNIEVPDSFQHKLPGTSSHYKWLSIKETFSLKQSIEELIQIDRERGFTCFSKVIGSLKPIDGAAELIEMLHKKGLKLAVASSSPLRMIHLIIKSFNLFEYFEVLVSGDFVEKGKPEPDIFIYAAEKLGVKCENCLVIEDSSNGVKAAKKAGMKCIGFINENSGIQDLSQADIIVDSIRKINI